MSRFNCYLVVARCPMDDVPVRLFEHKAEAESCADIIAERGIDHPLVTTALHQLGWTFPSEVLGTEVILFVAAGSAGRMPSQCGEYREYGDYEDAGGDASRPAPSPSVASLKG